MILEKFFTDKYDNKIVFVNPDMTFGEFKKYVYGQKLEFEKSAKNTVVLLCENYFEYTVNFFAAVFARKEIYLLTDKTRLSLLDFDYILPAKPTEGSGKFSGEFDAKKIEINLFTSGSTGTPKNIMKTLYNFESESISAIKEFNLTDEHIIVSTTSSAHSYGMTFNFILPFSGGFKINSKKIEYPEQLDIKGKYILISTPSFLEKLAKYDFQFEENAPEMILLAGAKLKEELFQYYSRFSKVIDIYGSTETGDIGWKNGGEIFNVFEDVEVSAADDDRITVKSEFFPAGTIILNDIVEMISPRKFILKKRTDRIVKILEKRISLDELENNLKRHKSVKDCRCLLYKDRLCCAVASSDSTLKGADYKKFLSQYSEILPKKWRILDEIPKNACGKIDYEKLKKIFGSNLSIPFVFSRQHRGENAEIELLFRENSNFLNGHFDGMPVIPGVVQLYYARFFAEDIFGQELPHNEIKRVKFSNIMKPENKIKLKLIEKEKAVEFAYMADDKLFSSGIFVK